MNVKSAMRAVYTTNNINGKIHVGEKDLPSIGERDILVYMHAASINPIDWRFIGFIAPFYPFSITLGHDGAGVVVAVGKKVSRFSVGDKVYGLKVYAFRGSFAEYFALNENCADRIPDNISLIEGAALPLVGLTAIQALRWARLEPGQHVLVIGGSGGVGHIAVQVAKAQGARVTAVCSTRNVAFVKSLGADEVIDYTWQDALEVVRGVDVVLDTVGKLSHRQCRPVLNPGGCYVTTFPNWKSIPEVFLSCTIGKFFRNCRLSWFVILDGNRKDMETLSALVQEEKVVVAIDTLFEMKDINSAFEISKQSRTVGKNVVLINGGEK